MYYILCGRGLQQLCSSIYDVASDTNVAAKHVSRVLLRRAPTCQKCTHGKTLALSRYIHPAKARQQNADDIFPYFWITGEIPPSFVTCVMDYRWLPCRISCHTGSPGDHLLEIVSMIGERFSQLTASQRRGCCPNRQNND